MSLERLKDLMLNDNGFAFDPRTGLTYTISATGLTVIRGLKELDETRIVERILADYEVDSRTAARDVRRFLESLRRLGLVDSNAEGDVQTRSSTATPIRSFDDDEANAAQE